MEFLVNVFGFLGEICCIFLRFSSLLVITRDERPVEDDADLEADPDVHEAVEDDEAGKGKLKIGVEIYKRGFLFLI